MAKSAARLPESSHLQGVDLATAADSDRVFIIEKGTLSPGF